MTLVILDIHQQWNVYAIEIIHNELYLWWSSPEASFCSLDRVGNQFSDNEKLMKITIWKLHDTIRWYLNITKPIISHFVVQLSSFFVSILVKLYCFTSRFVPRLEANLVVSKLTNRDSEHCWWSLLSVLNAIINMMVPILYLFPSNHSVTRVSPGHQKPWFWPYMLSSFLSFLWVDSNEWCENRCPLQWMNEWMNEWMKNWMNESMNELSLLCDSGTPACYFVCSSWYLPVLGFIDSFMP